MQTALEHLRLVSGLSTWVKLLSNCVAPLPCRLYPAALAFYRNLKVWGERVLLLGRALPTPSTPLLTLQVFLTKILRLEKGAKECIV